jgi:hypothetical protein
MKLAVAIIHGLGTEEQFFSVELKHRIVEQYLALHTSHNEDDLIFQEIFWGDLVSDSVEQLKEKVNYKNDLAYQELRRNFIDYLGVSHAYRDGIRNDLYKDIHKRIRKRLTKLANTRRVEGDSTPLIVLAHSFGGVIMSDYIWDMRKQQAASNKDLENLSALEQFDTFSGFVTFGNPMALFAATNPAEFTSPIVVKGAALEKGYQAMARWYNFYDKDDVVAYPLKGLNDEYKDVVAEDIEINVGSAATSWNPNCHSGYWEDLDFYKPVAKFLGELQAETALWKK